MRPPPNAGIRCQESYACRIGTRDVRVEAIDARITRFEHEEIKTIVCASDANRWLDICNVTRHVVGVLLIDGRSIEQLGPGLYAFWNDNAAAWVIDINVREAPLDVSSRANTAKSLSEKVVNLQ
jgi:hypothetical protein